MLVFLSGRHGLRVNFGLEACTFLARSLREACAKLAKNWAEKLSLAGLLLIVNLHLCFPTRGLERRNYMRQPMVQIQIGCGIATQTYENIFKETT